MKLESWHAPDDKAKFKIVKTCDYSEIDGVIVCADEATGECMLTIHRETKGYSYGPRGIRIVKKGRSY